MKTMQTVENGAVILERIAGVLGVVDNVKAEEKLDEEAQKIYNACAKAIRAFDQVGVATRNVDNMLNTKFYSKYFEDIQKKMLIFE